MKVMVAVKTSSLTIFLSHNDPINPIITPKIGPPPADLTKLTTTYVGLVSSPRVKPKKT